MARSANENCENVGRRPLIAPIFCHLGPPSPPTIDAGKTIEFVVGGRRRRAAMDIYGADRCTSTWCGTIRR